MTTKPKFTMHSDGQVSMYLGDGFANFLTGLGHADIKVSGNTYVPPVITSDLEAAYRTSTWFGKIVDIPAEDEVREWRTWQLENDQVEKVEAEERRLGLKAKLLVARQWARLYGGSAILMGGLPGSTDMPVLEDSVRVGAIKFLTVLARDEITPGPVVRNPLNPMHGRPEFFTLNTGGGQIKVDSSRVVTFTGKRISPASSNTEFWGDPIWFRLEQAIKSADQSGAVIDALMQEAKIDVIRVSGMMKNMATAEYEALMIRRFTMVAILKGMQNVMMLDKDDEWTQKQINWSGLPEVAKHILNILSGASNIPMFRLTGQNLTGLSSSGDAEQRAYYDGVRSDQNLKLRPSLDPLDNMLVRSALGEYPVDTWYEWNSLYQMTDKEKAEIDKLEADAANVYATSGLIPSEALGKAVQARMINSGRWPALEQAIDELPEDEEEDDKLVASLSALLARAQPEQPDPQQSGNPAQVSDAEPRTLYVRRDVKNWKEISEHFKRQGFKTTLGDDMHVTIVYSKTPVDWMKLGSSWNGELKIVAGGPRLMEEFGDNGEAKVLLFSAEELRWRHESALEIGATSSYPEYQPHITISWDPESSIEGVEAWQGEILLGPEIFQEIDENWQLGLVEDQNGRS